jgi:hypothetical protein
LRGLGGMYGKLEMSLCIIDSSQAHARILKYFYASHTEYSKCAFIFNICLMLFYPDLDVSLMVTRCAANIPG